jgi:hypothetical protein
METEKQETKYVEISEVDKLFAYGFFFIFFLSALSFFFGFFIAPQSRDFENYASFYHSLSTQYGGLDSGERFELGFKFLSFLISKFFPDQPRTYFSILIGVSLIVKYIIILLYSGFNHKKSLLFIILYLLSFVWVFEINQIREAIGLSFGFISLWCYHKHKPFQSLLFFFIAFSFHYTSIIFLVGLYAIYLLRKDKKTFLFIVITFVTLLSKFAIAVFESINPIAAEYKNNYDGVTFGITSITFILASVFLLYSMLNINKESKINIALIAFLYTGLLFYLVINDIPVYQIRILELTEVACLIIGINRKFDTLYNYGSLVLLSAIIIHKLIAYIFVNPLFG